MSQKKEQYGLYLDDCRTVTENFIIPANPYNPIDDFGDSGSARKLPWVIARTYEEFVQVLAERGIPAVVSFDHDLDEEHMQEYFRVHENGLSELDYSRFTVKTGVDCIDALAEAVLARGERPPGIINLHTHNRYAIPVMKKRLEEKIQRPNITVVRLPFRWEPDLLPPSLRS